MIKENKKLMKFVKKLDFEKISATQNASTKYTTSNSKGSNFNEEKLRVAPETERIKPKLYKNSELAACQLQLQANVPSKFIDYAFKGFRNKMTANKFKSSFLYKKHNYELEQTLKLNIDILYKLFFEKKNQKAC